MVINWLLYPVALTVAATGHGLLVRRVARGPSNLLLLPTGFASMIVLTTMCMVTSLHGVAWLAIVVPTVAGLVLGRADLAAFRAAPRADWQWAAGAALIAFGIFAVPVVLSGQLSFTGYSMITDTGNHFDLTAQLVEFGKVRPNPVDSSYAESVRKLMDANYPIGLHSLLGGWSELLGRELAWMYQPTVAFAAPMGALAAFGVLRWIGLPPALRAAAAVVVVQPNLLFAYGLVAGFKELFGAMMLLAVLALLVEGFQAADRRLIVAAVPLAAGICVFTVTIAPWMGMVLLVFFLAAMIWPGATAGGRVRTLGRWILLTATAVVLSWPLFPSIKTSSEVSAGTGGLSQVVTSTTDIGNLAAPLDGLTSVGIWLTGDYRYPLASNIDLTHGLIYLVIALAALGAASAFWRRRPEIVAAALAAVVVLLVVPSRTGPWVDAKVFAVTGTLILLLAFMGAAVFAQRRRTIPLAWILAAIVSGGVLYGNALAIHSATLAPVKRLSQLEDIARHFGSEGPTLAPSFDEYAEYFLRHMKTTGRVNPPAGFAGDPPLFGADIDNIGFEFVEGFKLLVVRRNPQRSRPPGNYALAYRTADYDVWRRVADRSTLVTHIPLDPGLSERPKSLCDDLVAGLGAYPKGGRLRWALATRPTVFLPTDAPVRAGNWAPDPAGAAVRTNGPGRVAGAVTIEEAGTYRLWQYGSFERPLTIVVDGKVVARLSYLSDYGNEAINAGVVTLGKGRHTVELRRGGGSLRPGNGDATGSRYAGPLLFEREGGSAKPFYTSSVKDTFKVCRSNRPLDWVELLPPSA
ncbi:MAG: hypothetical protein ACJ762_05345 [Solirubrobacteraceae bacterium]